MSKRKRVLRFQPGDRVAEKPKVRMIYARNETKEKLKQYAYQRYGTVLDTVYKTNKTGQKLPYVKIIWDGTQSPSEHAQNRLCFEKDLPSLMVDYFNSKD